MGKAPTKTNAEQNEVYRRTNMTTGNEELFYVDSAGVEHAVGGTGGGGGPHAATHADGGTDELVDATPTPSTQAFGDAPSVGADTSKAAPVLHKHGMMADPVPAHVAAGDPHTQYSTNTEFDDHNARHEPGGADPMAVDAAAATGSLRTLGAGATQAVSGTDSRLSDARTALAHALVGALHTLAGGTAGFVVRAVDATSFAWARLAHSDLTIDSSHSHASTTGQTANDHHAQLHHAAHEPGGGDPMAVDAAAGTGSLRTLGGGASQAVSGTDSRLSDARTPLAHHATHEYGGSDTVVGKYAAGASFTLADGEYRIMAKRLTLAAAERLTQAGTSRLVIL